MAELHNVDCPVCGENVNAELLEEGVMKNRYKCPNVSHEGKEHNFSKKTVFGQAFNIGVRVFTMILIGDIIHHDPGA